MIAPSALARQRAGLAVVPDAEGPSIVVEKGEHPHPAGLRVADPGDRADAMEREAAALLRLASATRELAVARAAAAEAGIAQWCEGCDEAMPARRQAALCPRCTARANKNRWARDDRAAARLDARTKETTCP